MKCLYFIRNMRDTSAIMDQLRDMRHELKERYHIRSIGIFGSYSREHQTGSFFLAGDFFFPYPNNFTYTFSGIYHRIQVLPSTYVRIRSAASRNAMPITSTSVFAMPKKLR